MQEQFSTGTFTAVGKNRPASLDGWTAQPLAGGNDAVFTPPAETEAEVVKQGTPSVLRVLQSVGRAFMALCLSGASTNCVRCNAPVDGYADVTGDANSISPCVNYHCRNCDQSWDQYLVIDPYA